MVEDLNLLTIATLASQFLFLSEIYPLANLKYFAWISIQQVSMSQKAATHGVQYFVLALLEKNKIVS